MGEIIKPETPAKGKGKRGPRVTEVGCRRQLEDLKQYCDISVELMSKIVQRAPEADKEHLSGQIAALTTVLARISLNGGKS